MTRIKAAEAMSAKTGMTREASARALEALLEVITESLAAGEDVQFVNFGTFSLSGRSPRNCRNPRTGELMTVPGSRVPVFKPGKVLSEAVKEKSKE